MRTTQSSKPSHESWWAERHWLIVSSWSRFQHKLHEQDETSLCYPGQQSIRHFRQSTTENHCPWPVCYFPWHPIYDSINPSRFHTPLTRRYHVVWKPGVQPDNRHHWHEPNPAEWRRVWKIKDLPTVENASSWIIARASGLRPTQTTAERHCTGILLLIDRRRERASERDNRRDNSVWNSLPRQLRLKLPWRLVCSNPISAS